MSSKEDIKNASSKETIENFAVIREERSIVTSSTNIDALSEKCTECSCISKQEQQIEKILSPEDVEKLLKEKEQQLTVQFQEHLEKEVSSLKERFEFILQNEQVRASCMLREAHRERQEKITALRTQLECKNLAGLMFVMCSERRKSKLEKLRLIEQYTGYIVALQDILTEAQDLILNMSRGYKTAARVDEEWRQKMKVTLKEFQNFIHDFVKGTPETEQFFFNIPTLLKTEAAIVDNPLEDACDCDPVLLQEQQEGLEQEQKTWYDDLEESCRPFVLFGDLETFKPDERREVLRKIKHAKIAPRKWKNYVFNEMYAKADCCNLNTIKDLYQNLVPVEKWECDVNPEFNASNASRRATAASVDIRGNMGSILKIITQNTNPPPRATLLGARDSMEIASTTKLKARKHHSGLSRVVIKVGRRSSTNGSCSSDDTESPPDIACDKSTSRPEEDVERSASGLGSTHNDSLHVIGNHVPDKDATINYEKVCPMEKCQRLKVDSFIRSLPPYMRASPYTLFEQTFEQYETCSPEQLEILKQRLEKKVHEVPDMDPLVEWTPSVGGVGVQTSELSMSLPPCTCRVPRPTPVSSSDGIMFDVQDLLPMKEVLDQINQNCFYDNRIEFDRFKVIGEDGTASSNKGAQKNNRLQDITKILKMHPSLLDIFQANAV